MNLLEFYKLKENPFSTTVDSRFFYHTKQHAEALVRLKYSAESMKGLALLVGDIGTGKTMLATRLLEDLDPNRYEAAMLVVIHAAVTSEWMLRKMAYQMEVQSPAQSKTELLTQLSRRLEEVFDSGKQAVVLIDEAQMLRSQELMEDFRGLLNIEINGRKAVTFILFGLMELDHALALDPALHQRVGMRYELTPLDTEGTAAYVNHRLRVAGAQESPFAIDTFSAICDYARGIPRLINGLCDNAMLEGYLRKQELIQESLIHEVAKDLKLTS